MRREHGLAGLVGSHAARGAPGLLIMTCVACALASCNGASDVGERKEPAAQAIASAIGQPYTLDSDGNLHTTVRAGADVLLSANDSRKGDNDTGSPLISFAWEQLEPGALPVQLIRRTSSSVSFVAPQVTEDTTLRFKLTVSDGSGESDSTEAHVLVKPFRDADHFLQYLGVDGTFPVVVASDLPIAADADADPAATLPVTVTMTKLATFVDRGGVQHVRVPVGTPVTVTTGWTARVGSGGDDCAANENPAVEFPAPRLNLDDVTAAADGKLPAGTVLSDVVELDDVGLARLEVRLDAESSAATPLLCVDGSATPLHAGVVVDAETLRAGESPRDSEASAFAYYWTIDPTFARLTLDGWLDANGFDSSVKGWNADAHAIYTNNYDLGFGRDMYMKFGACDSGAEGLPLEQRIGKCDVAAVVVNYAGVEAAVKGLNPIVAVAMEYSAAIGGTQRFVKFYTYAFDTRTGEFNRVESVNLDRRGELYMPQACTVCHGGTPGTFDPTTGEYSNGGDVSSAFLSFDLDSLLYSDTDPGFSHKSRDAALKAEFTRASQEAEFKKLNVGAYLTLADPPNAAGRYALARELLEGWYGGPGLPNDTFDGDFVPQTWKPEGVDGVANTGDDNPADAATIYADVFARNCRMCHIAQVPVAGVDPRDATVTVAGAGSLPACTNDVRLAGTRVGVSFQVPMGCYWEFAHAPNLADRLSRNLMPFARRTSDRMWVSEDGPSAGEVLTAHLLAAQGTSVDAPGTPYACIDSFGARVEDQGVTKLEVERGVWLTLGSTCSRFLGQAQWTLSAPSGSGAALVGADTAAPRFVPDVQGDYVLSLSDAGGASSTSVTALVPVAVPVAGDGTASMALGSGGSGTVDVDVTTLMGFQSRDGIASTSIDSQNGVTAVVVGPTVVRITGDSLSGGTVTYHLTDIDGDLSTTGTITLQVSADISAGSPTLTFAANSTGNDIDLDSLVSRPAGEAITLTVTQPVRQRFRGRGSVSAPNSSGHVAYNAPPGVTSHFGGTLIDAGSLDSFTYEACFSAQPSKCASGTITIQLSSTHSFPAVQAQMSLNCAICHVPAIGANPEFIVEPTYASAAERHELYCKLKTLTAVNDGSDLGDTEMNGAPYLNLAVPASSLLYLKPQGSYGHGGTVVGNSTTWNTILNWIDDGAYFTESTAQACP